MFVFPFKIGQRKENNSLPLPLHRTYGSCIRRYIYHKLPRQQERGLPSPFLFLFLFGFESIFGFKLFSSHNLLIYCFGFTFTIRTSVWFATLSTYHLVSSSFCSQAQGFCYTSSFTHRITPNGLRFATLGGKYP